MCCVTKKVLQISHYEHCKEVDEYEVFLMSINGFKIIQGFKDIPLEYEGQGNLYSKGKLVRLGVNVEKALRMLKTGNFET